MGFWQLTYSEFLGVVAQLCNSGAIRVWRGRGSLGTSLAVSCLELLRNSATLELWNSLTLRL